MIYPCVFHKSTGHFLLIRPPHLMNAKGAGVAANARIPSTVFPIPKPSALYTAGPTRGKKAPKMERVKTRTATADAAVSRNASTAYV
jgi:hypothetical protein